MKFRCKINQSELNLFSSCLISLLKFSDHGLIYFDNTTIRLTCLNNLINIPKIYLTFNSLLLCHNDYKVESNNENNIIIFEINLLLLLKALQGIKLIQYAIFKLVKRNNKPCLNIEFISSSTTTSSTGTTSSSSSSSSSSLNLIYDIPIKLTRIQETSIYLLPPTISYPKVSLILPKNKIIKNLYEKLSKISKLLEIEAKQKGKISLRLTSSQVNIQTFLHSLIPIYNTSVLPSSSILNSNGNSSHSSSSSPSYLTEERDHNNKVSVIVNLKKFSLVMDYHHIKYHQASICNTFFFSLYLSFYLSFS